MEDGSEANVAGKRSRAPVLCVPGLATICIMPNRSKVEMKRAFRMVLGGPPVAGVCRGAYAFAGECQTCNVHLRRKSESAGVKRKIVSLERTYCTMLLGVYGRTEEAAEYATKMAGGATKSACGTGRIVRTVPGLAEFAKARAEVAAGMKKAADAYRRGEISDPPKTDATQGAGQCRPLHGALIAHPSMPGSVNETWRIMRGRVVKTCNVRRTPSGRAGPAPRRCCRPSAPPAAYSPGARLPAAGIWSRTAPKADARQAAALTGTGIVGFTAAPRTARAVAARLPGGGGVARKGGGVELSPHRNHAAPHPQMPAFSPGSAPLAPSAARLRRNAVRGVS